MKEYKDFNWMNILLITLKIDYPYLRDYCKYFNKLYLSFNRKQE